MKKYLFILFFLLFSLACLTWLVLDWRAGVVRERQRQAELSRRVPAPQVSVTIPEGLTVDEVYARLSEKDFGSVADFKLAENAIDRSRYGFLRNLPKGASLEGFLFPDTYRFHTDAKPQEIIARLVGEFGVKWGTLTQEKPELMTGGEIVLDDYGLKLSVKELVTLASIVEKETGRFGETASSKRLLEERQTVAGIFYNRLLIGQALESDATVNYVTKAGRASPTFKDLEASSPYNTYKNPGLPPGPIASPSFSSLYAVLNPIKTDYYYFLHKQPSGEVVYSKTFSEHLQNKNKFLK